jgi:hypothetical protein
MVTEKIVTGMDVALETGAAVGMGVGRCIVIFISGVGSVVKLAPGLLLATPSSVSPNTLVKE